MVLGGIYEITRYASYDREKVTTYVDLDRVVAVSGYIESLSFWHIKLHMQLCEHPVIISGRQNDEFQTFDFRDALAPRCVIFEIIDQRGKKYDEELYDRHSRECLENEMNAHIAVILAAIRYRKSTSAGRFQGTYF